MSLFIIREGSHYIAFVHHVLDMLFTSYSLLVKFLERKELPSCLLPHERHVPKSALSKDAEDLKVAQLQPSFQFI